MRPKVSNSSEDINREEDATGADTKILGVIQEFQATTIGESSKDSSLLVWDENVVRLKPLEELCKGNEAASTCHEVAVAAIHPIFKKTMSEWSPLKDPVGVAPHLEALRLVLGVETVSVETTIATQNDLIARTMHHRSTSHYETMIYTFWLPPVRSAITQEWDVKDPVPLLRLVEVWKPILPPFILANVIDQLVVKRLTDAVAAWNPVRSRRRNSHSQPPHVCLFPWLQYLDEQHTDPRSPIGLMADVKRKFKTILSTWNLSQGLIPGLENWRSIFQSELSNMLVRYLLPRFRPHLADFEVNPRQQDETFEILEDILQWAPFFSINTMADILKSEFFPKWHQSLYLWLTTPGVRYNEVSEWYTWWKGIFEERISAEFNDLRSIMAEWETGLQFMFQASEIGPEAASELPPPMSTVSSAQTRTVEQMSKAGLSPRQTSNTPEGAGNGGHTYFVQGCRRGLVYRTRFASQTAARGRSSDWSTTFPHHCKIRWQRWRSGVSQG